MLESKKAKYLFISAGCRPSFDAPFVSADSCTLAGLSALSSSAKFYISNTSV